MTIKLRYIAPLFAPGAIGAAITARYFRGDPR
jgi:hypothetical protein